MVSLGPPAGNGTIGRIGLEGNSYAATDAGNSSTDKPASSVRKIRMNVSPGRMRVPALLFLP